ncbi:uncharacterized protein SOCG_05098 [Schizosaccharomyces octosporus yFS286]|uniref:Secreted protein n=1 Tax=Schizosaccharomyces octosporus (strain yFS286) TaxID=483514 RepID=S9PY92_SCHOY|nr:uncharacterized protein SOCG_05098 [Schizosaccharomyces octosporus yFS286]EPX74051.1 hypothetical protein SOCG_05098 [Schizosaccharomyces octosporus yFS286]
MNYILLLISFQFLVSYFNGCFSGSGNMNYSSKTTSSHITNYHVARKMSIYIKAWIIFFQRIGLKRAILSRFAFSFLFVEELI